MSTIQDRAQCSRGRELQELRESLGLSHEDAATYWGIYHWGRFGIYGDGKCCEPSKGTCSQHERVLREIAANMRRLEQCSQRIYDRAQMPDVPDRQRDFRASHYMELQAVLALAATHPDFGSFYEERHSQLQAERDEERRIARARGHLAGVLLVQGLRAVKTDEEFESVIRGALAMAGLFPESRSVGLLSGVAEEIGAAS